MITHLFQTFKPRRQKRARLGCVLLFCAALFFPHQAQAAITGSGTSASPYIISDAADFATFAGWIDAGTNNTTGTYYKLGASFTYTLSNGVGSLSNRFKGNFDGAGYTITIPDVSTHASTHYVGLFQSTENATIQNLYLSCGAIDAQDYSGALIGEAVNNLTVENVHVTQSGTTNRKGMQSGGFIGKFYRNSGSPQVLISNCSYINTGTLQFLYNNEHFDGGGFVGQIAEGFSSVTFKDCLVHINKVDYNGNSGSGPFGAFIGAALSNVTMIRCVQAGSISGMDASKNRAYIVGFIASGKTVSCYATYAYGTPYRGTGRYSTGTLSDGITDAASWGDYDYEYRRLERKNDSGGDISSSTRGNERWGVFDSYPTLTSTNYAIRITRGSNVSSVSGSGYNSSPNHYRAANTSLTLSNNVSLTSHQRGQYVFTPAYQPSSGTAYTLDNNILKTKVSGTVDYLITKTPYPYIAGSTANAINAELKPFDNKITVSWNYDNPDNQTGKFYVYIKENAATNYTNLTPSGLTLANGNGKSMTYDITTTNFQFNKTYTIYVGYEEGTAPATPVDITQYNRASISSFSTAVSLGNWTAAATGGLNKITVTMNGIPSQLINSADYSYKIQRSINGNSYEDWLTNQNFSGVSAYTHDNTGVTVTCDIYKYKVIISAFGTTFEKETDEAHSTGNTAFLTTETPMKATKGEHAGYVRLQWKVNRSTGGSDDIYKVFRCIAGTEDWTEMETVTSNAGTVYWQDNNALTGVFYKYKVVLYQNCSNTLTELDRKDDIGFTQAFGTVSGRITYGAGGNAVKDVNVLVRSNALQEGENQYYSLKATGGGQKFEWLADSAYFNTLWTNKNWTLQFWVNPNGDNTEPVTIGYLGGYAISMTAVTGGYQIYTALGTAYKSEIIPANKFSHIAITREANNVKIYTVCDQNPDSIYIKNTPFTYSTATAQTAPNSKISFGHALKGNIDDVRFWNKALTEAEILRDYSRVLTGSESGLKAYWTFDENLANYAFDRSRAGTVYNSNHATANTLVSDAKVPDDTYQLALKGITDANGNYQISGIAYQGEGTSYSIVPSLGVDNGEIDGRHKFNPTEQLRYISPSSMVHNATDFTDISAFMLRGKVVYEGGNYPVTDCSFEIDGQAITMPNGTVVKTDNVGEFEISVPIGQHSVRVVKQGHTFANGGYLKNENNVDYIWNAPKAGIVFNDQTKVKLLGRVVGGNAEDGKPLGFGESVNNIGVQTLVLNSTRQAYNFSNTPVSATYSHNSGEWKKPGSLSNDSTKVDYNQKNITVHVSPITGEFSAMVYPEPYDIQPINVTQGSGQPLLVIKENAENIDLTPTAVPDSSYLQTSIRTWRDSAFVANRPGVVDHWEYTEKSDTVRYNSKWTYKYQSTPTFGVTQVVNDVAVDYFGELTFELKDELAGTTETLNLYNQTTDTYLFGKPVFRQGKKYDLRFNAYEQYINHVSDPAVTVTYPISNGSVSMSNNLQVTPQPEGLTMDSLGILNYQFTAGAPNLTTAQGDIFATLSLGAVSYNWNMGTTPLEAWQLGEKTTGTNFMTSGPDQLTAILRDPPGTASFAYIESGTTVSSTSTTSVGTNTATELNLTTSLGPKVTAFIGLGAGVITESEVKLDASVGLSTETSYSDDTEETATTTFTERFETSSAPDYVGAPGDVFIGNSTNILYGLTNGIQIQKSVTAGTTYATQGDYKIASSAAIAYGQDFATRFAFTAMELENIMIPKWQNSIANRLLPVDTTVNAAAISAPVYVSKLAPEDENYGKWNLDEVFKTNPAFNRQNPYDGVSYKIYFPTSWTQMGDEMKAFQDSVLWANNQINTWVAVLAQNEKEKVEMTQKGNYSFGGGASIEYSESKTASTSYTHNFGFTITPSLGAVIGGEVMGIGVELETKVAVSAQNGGSTGKSKETNITSGFVLAEEGTVDEITVDYGYTAGGTFAFKTRGGQTSCPYEGEVLTKYFEPNQHILQEATMRVEVPVIEVSSAAQVLNVPANRTANFTLALQNESEVNEDTWFMLTVDEETNPNGAELKIDGIGNGRTFLVRAGQVLTKTLTISKGTVDDYDNIGIILQSLCEPETVADTVWVSAHFVPACSEVAIAAPANNFIVNTESPNGSTLSVTLQNFDVNFPNFGYIRLEYRAAGTPDWSTARTFYPTLLFADPTNTDGTKEDIGDRAAIIYDWTMPSADGQYELRATTASVNIVNNTIVGNPLSTYSTNAITGYKDMVKPVAIGAPSPANGIYGAGNELSVTFNEEINTSMLISDNIKVTYGASNTIVPMSFVASSNKITMEYPSDYFSILEEQTLNIEVKDIYDMRGNKSEPTVWTAFVNRNALVWDSDPINLTKEAGKSLTFTAKIKNAGNSTISYSFDDANLNMHLPQWLSVNAPKGSLVPLETKELTFTVSGNMNLGDYTEQIGITSGNLVSKKLALNLRVTGAHPDWSVNPEDFEYSMTATGRVYIENVLQEDEEDLLAAFIGDVCVGIASLQYEPAYNTYFVFMTVWGNNADNNKNVSFKLWDASTGNIYPAVETSIGGSALQIKFNDGGIEGTPDAPVRFNALAIIEQAIAMGKGWNWISFNVDNYTTSLLDQFKTNAAGFASQIKAGNSQYLNNSGGNWGGQLSSITPKEAYLVKSNNAAGLKMLGKAVKPSETPITLAADKWSWISYTPQFTATVTEALAGISNPQQSDQIKGQKGYRMMSANGWIGNLSAMEPGRGYMYKSNSTQTVQFNYPDLPSSMRSAPLRSSQNIEPAYEADMYRYSGTMTVTASLWLGNTEVSEGQFEIAAFSGDECRGSALLESIDGFEHGFMAFLMIYGEGDEANGLRSINLLKNENDNE